MSAAGLAQAVQAAGGKRPLARALGISQHAVQRWERVPQERVFAVARATRLAPEILRPDLAQWIRDERGRQRLAEARVRFSLVRAAAPAAPDAPASAEQVVVDLLTTLAAARFVAGERQISLAAVVAGRTRDAMGARSWASALAHVAGRASSTVVGAFFGASRQNVDNASERYLRARDGDDAEDFIPGNDGRARVIERGRLRPAKSAELDLWAAEHRFRALLEGVAEERKRA